MPDFGCNNQEIKPPQRFCKWSSLIDLLVTRVILACFIYYFYCFCNSRRDNRLSILGLSRTEADTSGIENIDVVRSELVFAIIGSLNTVA